MAQLSGKNFNIVVGDVAVFVENMSASITDNTKTAMTRGVPNGRVDGDKSCTGELELDYIEFNKLNDVAKSAGSWSQLPDTDIVCVGSFMGATDRLELFGCVLTISDLTNIDPKGGEKAKRKIKFEVCSPKFVRINGVPYLSNDEIKGL